MCTFQISGLSHEQMASLNASLQLPALQGTSVQNDEGVGSSQLRQHSSHSHSHPSNVVTMASTITTDLGKAMQRRHKNKELARRSRLRKRLDFLLLLLQRYSVNLHLFLNIHGNRITELPFVATVLGFAVSKLTDYTWTL
jgi:hypothetical protein